jgi:hypothetical protein
LEKGRLSRGVFFLELPSVELAIGRVADRVAQGGHDIPQAEIRRRFTTGKRNFMNLSKSLADAWRHYDHAGASPLLRPIMKTKQTWIQQANNALMRAAKRAREVAERTNTPLHVIRDGKIVQLMPSTGDWVLREDLPACGKKKP